jgi:hypothetical protein
LALQPSHLTRVAATRRRPGGALGCSALALACLAGAGAGVPAWAQSSNMPLTTGIYTCIDDKGLKRTSDRPIAECSDREQRLLNRDGSLKKVVPPTLTPDERAEREAKERKEAEERATLADAVRRDRNLKARFPNEAAHNRARQGSLEVVRASLRASDQRIRELEAERKPLSEEVEFYRGRKMPARLKQQIEANETSIAAQRELMKNQEAELVRVNRMYDLELEHLRKLWNGARPGSVSVAGPVVNTSP